MDSAEREPDFDTLAYAQTLKAAGVEDKQAEAHAKAQAAAARTARKPALAKAGGFATKADLERAVNRILMAVMGINAILFAAIKFL